MRGETASTLAQKRMWLLFKMLYGQEHREIVAMLQTEPRGNNLRKAYQKVDDAIVEAIVAESRTLAAALQGKCQAP